jgi:hypothetical protein
MTEAAPESPQPIIQDLPEAEASLLYRWRPLSLLQKQLVSQYLNFVWKIDFTLHSRPYTTDDGREIVFFRDRTGNLFIQREEF